MTLKMGVGLRARGPSNPSGHDRNKSSLFEQLPQKAANQGWPSRWNVIVDISVRFCVTLEAIDFGLTRRAPGDWTLEDSNPRLPL
jgi:hypothetical protein